MNKRKSIPQQKPSQKKEKDNRSLLSFFERNLNFIGVLTIPIIAILIYSNSFDASFHFDDMNNIVRNGDIRDLFNFQKWFSISPTRIVGVFTLALNYHFNKLDVFGYHVFNLLIHIINGYLVFWLTSLIMKTPAAINSHWMKHPKYFAWLVAVFFVAHPLATSSVTYIIQRLASLAALFYFLSLAFYLKGRLSGQIKINKVGYFLLAFLFGLLSLFTKENSYTLPITIILIEFCFFYEQKNYFTKNKYWILSLLGIFLTSVVLILLFYQLSIFKPIELPAGPIKAITPLNYFFTQFKVIVKYIQLLIIPVMQSAEHDISISTNIFDWKTLTCFLFLLGIFSYGIYVFKRNRIISFGIFWFFLTLSVESSFIPIPDVIFEHRTYLPSFGYLLILGFIITGPLYNYRRNLAGISAMIIFLVFAGLSYNRNKVWKDDISLWSDTISKYPGLARPASNRGNAYMKMGMWEKALADFTSAIQADPGFMMAHYNRGVVYSGIGQWENAINDFNIAGKIAPQFTENFINRGVAYSSLKQWDKAILDFNKALSINPNSAKAMFNLGVAYSNLKNWNKAIEHYTNAIKINPKYPKAFYNLGIAYSALNKWDKAVESYSREIVNDPGFSGSYINRGVIYGKKLNWDKAISDYSAALQVNPDNIIALSNRGVAFNNTTQWQKAIADFSRIIELKKASPEDYYNRGYALGNLNDWCKAADDFAVAVKLAPGFAKAAMNLKIAMSKCK